MGVKYDHPSATCTLTMQKISPTNSYPSNIVVTLYFTNWDVLHHCCENKTDCPCACRGKCITLGKTYDIDSDVVRTNIVIPLKYETLQFNVLTAASIQDLPGYVTPGVWTSIKHNLLSLILDHVNFNADYSLSGYTMVAMVDVSTVSYVDHLPSHMFKKIVPRSPDVPILDDDSDRSEWLKKVLESLPRSMMIF
ncbi:hypothetical protein BVRB_7g166860 [Beta vulgaris subsp. vulgaris]|nr:hypothetical protein BVRB_7g166860 [Beta vulgaris subsp. vulgaris]